jgi:hypothetical protein
MSQEYIAIFSRGDQSSKPDLHASLTAVITDPVTCDMRFCTDVLVLVRPDMLLVPLAHTSLLFQCVGVNLHGLNKVCYAFNGLGAQGTLESRYLEAIFDLAIKLLSAQAFDFA